MDMDSWSGSRGSRENDQKAEVPLSWGQAESIGVAQPGREGSRETLEHIPVPEGPIRGLVVIEEEMA